MKMIASTKLTKAQRAMQAARAYGKANEGELGCPDLIVSMVFLICSCFIAMDRNLQELRGRVARGRKGSLRRHLL